LPAGERRARRDLAELERVLQKCERDYDPGAPGANADTLKAWAPFRLNQLELELRRYAPGVQRLPGAPGTRRCGGVDDVDSQLPILWRCSAKTDPASGRRRQGLHPPRGYP